MTLAFLVVRILMNSFISPAVMNVFKLFTWSWFKFSKWHLGRKLCLSFRFSKLWSTEFYSMLEFPWCLFLYLSLFLIVLNSICCLSVTCNIYSRYSFYKISFNLYILFSANNYHNAHTYKHVLPLVQGYGRVHNLRLQLCIKRWLHGKFKATK